MVPQIYTWIHLLQWAKITTTTTNENQSSLIIIFFSSYDCYGLQWLLPLLPLLLLLLLYALYKRPFYHRLKALSCCLTKYNALYHLNCHMCIPFTQSNVWMALVYSMYLYHSLLFRYDDCVRVCVCALCARCIICVWWVRFLFYFICYQCNFGSLRLYLTIPFPVWCVLCVRISLSSCTRTIAKPTNLFTCETTFHICRTVEMNSSYLCGAWWTHKNQR